MLVIRSRSFWAPVEILPKIVDEVVSDESTPKTEKSVAENSEMDESITPDKSTSEMIDNASKDHSEASDEDVKEEGKEPKKDLFS